MSGAKGEFRTFLAKNSLEAIFGIVLKECGHYDVYFGKVFHEVMKSTIYWFGETLR